MKNSKLSALPHHRAMLSPIGSIRRIRPASPVASRLHRRKGFSRWWLAQAMKNSVLFFVYFVYFVVALSASTITGNLQNTSGAAYPTNALFVPLSTPLASGNNVIASTSTNVVAAANGSFSVALKQGNYLVTIGNVHKDSFIISVPDDANTYNLVSLITNALTFNYTYSPMYEQRVNKGQADGYVGLNGTLMTPSGLIASNFSFLGTVNLGTDAANYATMYINQNSSLFVQPGAAFTLSGDSSPRAEMFLHGTNAFVRFDEDAGINDSTASKVWKFNRFNLTSNNVATLGDVTNIVNSSLEAGLLGDGSDGNLVFDGSSTVAGIAPASSVYTLARSLFASNLTINSGVTISNLGYRMFVLKNFTNNGTVTAAGKNGTAGGATGTPGAAGGSTPANDLGGSTSGGGGGTGSGMGGTGGSGGGAGSFVMGGNGGAGGSGGTATSGPNLGGPGGTAAAPRYFRELNAHLLAGANLVTGGQGGGGGGSGGQSGGNPGAGGGGGASGGGMVLIWAGAIYNGSGTITALGGTGGNGGNASNAGAGGSGGGGGGGGGVIFLAYNSLVPGSLTAAGGGAGLGGTGNGAGANGTNGVQGVSGVILKYNGSLKQWE